MAIAIPPRYSLRRNTISSISPAQVMAGINRQALGHMRQQAFGLGRCNVLQGSLLCLRSGGFACTENRSDGQYNQLK